MRTSEPPKLPVTILVSQMFPFRAIQNGANALAEGFLFSVAAGLILAEAYRSSRSNTKRREDVDDRIEALEERLEKAHTTIQRLEEKVRSVEEQEDIESARFVFQPHLSAHYKRVGNSHPGAGGTFRSEELSRVLSRIVDIGLRGGWAEFEDKPVPIPQGAHLQGSQFNSRARSDAPVLSETSSRSARSASSSASTNCDAPIEQQSSEEPVSSPHK